MNWYCEKCKKMHTDNELCPRIQVQLKQHPEWLKGAADFVTVAGKERLISTQALDGVAKQVSKVVGKELSYEGTKQAARDIQVFRRLNEEAFKRSGAFASAEAAKNYYTNVLEISKSNPGALRSFESKLTGYAQEADWLRWKNGQLSSLFEKSSLGNGNLAGIDGTTVSRFTGKEISRTTVKASQNTMTANSTAIRDVQEAIQKGTATEKDIIFGPVGTEKAARAAGLKNPVSEKNTVQQIADSNKRLEDKILSGNATTALTANQIGKKMAQGAVIGAAVEVTISSITSYVRYKNGELTVGEAFSEVSESGIKGIATGAAMGAITLFLPGGAIGFLAGVAIGLYLDKVCTNILDEIYGKGAFGAILNASGYVYGMTFNLSEYYRMIEENNKRTKANITTAEQKQQNIEDNFRTFEAMKGEL